MWVKWDSGCQPARREAALRCVARWKISGRERCRGAVVLGEGDVDTAQLRQLQQGQGLSAARPGSCCRESSERELNPVMHGAAGNL